MNLPAPAREIAAVCRRHRLTYATLAKAVHLARRHLNLRPPSTRSRRLPKLLSESQLRAFYAAVDNTDDIKHQLMLRLLFYTALRVSELTGIRVSDVDLSSHKIYIESGKGDKDRYVLFPATFGLTLRTYLHSITNHTDQEYLFESRQKRRYSERMIQRIVKEYAERAGLSGVHPHLLRHQCITHLTKLGLTDTQIQLISGHSSKESLAIYQHLALGDVQPEYEEAMKGMQI